MKKLNVANNKRRSIKLTDRFYALMTILLGIGCIFIWKVLQEIDMTGPIFVIIMGTLCYISTFGEDK